MEFIGENGVAALRLKDAAPFIKSSKWISLYLEVVKHVRTMYQTCKLVHGDLSEFNILYHKGKNHPFSTSNGKIQAFVT